MNFHIAREKKPCILQSSLRHKWLMITFQFQCIPKWSHFPFSLTRYYNYQICNPHGAFIFITYVSQNSIMYSIGLKFYNFI